MSSKTLLNVTIALVFVLIVGTPLFYVKQSVYPYILSKALFFQFFAELLFVSWLTLALRNPEYRPRRTPALWGMLALLAALSATGALGIDPPRSFWSTYERMVGVFTAFHLVALAVVVSSLWKALPWKSIFWSSLGTAFVAEIIAIIQKYWKPSILLDEPISRPGATFGNPTFLAGYLLFSLFLALYLLAVLWERVPHGRETAVENSQNKFTRGDAKKRTRTLQTILLAGFVAFTVFVVVFIAETRGDILGLVAALVALCVIFAIRPPALIAAAFSSRRLYAGILLGLVALGALFWFTRGAEAWASIPGLNRFRSVSFSVSDENKDLLPRLIAIRAAWQGFLERPLSGWGWDNFNVVYNKHYDPRALELSYKETRFDKPHNFALEDLVAGGVWLLLARLALMALFVFEALRARSVFGKLASAALAGFLVRSVFIFDTLGPALMFYLFLGYADGEYAAWRDRKSAIPAAGAPLRSRPARPTRAPGYAYALIGAGAIAAYIANVPTLQASYYEFLAYQRFVKGKPDLAIEYFKKALAKGGPYRWNVARDYAAATAEGYFYNKSENLVKPEYVREAISEMERVAREHPLDAYNHYALVDMYNQVSDVDPERYLAGADREANIALELSPNRQEVLFSMAKTQSIRGDYKGALVILERALALNRNVADAHFYYGLLAFENKAPSAGYEHLKTAMEMGRPWKNYHEPLVAANYFFKNAYFADAAALYEKALSMFNDRQYRDIVAEADSLADNQNFANAEKFYKRALSVIPQEQSPELYYKTKMKLGIVYFYVGERAGAKSNLEEAVRHLDVRKDPSFEVISHILEELGIPLPYTGR